MQKLLESSFTPSILKKTAEPFVKGLNVRFNRKYSLGVVSQISESIKYGIQTYSLPIFEENCPESFRIHWESDGNLDSITYLKEGIPMFAVKVKEPSGADRLTSDILDEIRSKALKEEKDVAGTATAITRTAGTDLSDPSLQKEIDVVVDATRSAEKELALAIQSAGYIANPFSSTRSLLLAGTPGIGKTYMIIQVLKEMGWKKRPNINYLRAKATPTECAIALFHNRKPGDVLVFDDCDSPWANENVMNLFKAALDNDEDNPGSGVVTWRLRSGSGQPADYPLDGVFNFYGKIVFISNLTEEEITSRNPEAIEAVLSRGSVVEMKFTKEEIYQHINNLLPSLAPDIKDQSIKKEVLDYVFNPQVMSRMKKVSIRTIVNAINMRVEHPNSWKTGVLTLR